MNIVYDAQARIAGIGLVPWTRLGPERWFHNYKIASLYGWDLPSGDGAPDILSLDKLGDVPGLAKFTSQDLVDTAEFQQLITSYLRGYRFLTYKPIRAPVLTGTNISFVSMNPELTQTIENKAEFRKTFADLDLPLPAFDIYERASLTPDLPTLHKLLKNRQSVILQDEKLSGGRGTFMVSTLDELKYALLSIESLKGGSRVIVSDHITPARERSVQACATRHGVFVGPLQKQIIGEPLLAHLDVPDGDRFCGAEISPDDDLRPLYPEIKRYAEQLGKRLIDMGYRGIFSVDCLIDAADKVYVLEVNPRLTGITPLLTALHREGRDIPFYLLHILETVGMDYKITDFTIDDMPPTGSLLVVHAHNSKRALLGEVPSSGVYDSNMRYVKPGFNLESDSAQLLVQRYAPPGFRLKPGNRIFSVLSRQPVLDSREALRPHIVEVVKYLQANTAYKEVVS